MQVPLPSIVQIFIFQLMEVLIIHCIQIVV